MTLKDEKQSVVGEAPTQHDLQGPLHLTSLAHPRPLALTLSVPAVLFFLLFFQFTWLVLALGVL